MLLLDEKKILDNSLKYHGLKFNKFLEVNEIDMDNILVDRIFHNIANNIPIYIIFFDFVES